MMDTTNWLAPVVALWAAIRLPIAGLLLAGSSCLATGCGPGSWKVKSSEIETQFEIAYTTSLKIGFPGRVKGQAEGTYDATPKPAPTEPQ